MFSNFYNHHRSAMLIQHPSSLFLSFFTPQLFKNFHRPESKISILMINTLFIIKCFTSHLCLQTIIYVVQHPNNKHCAVLRGLRGRSHSVSSILFNFFFICLECYFWAYCLFETFSLRRFNYFKRFCFTSSKTKPFPPILFSRDVF